MNHYSKLLDYRRWKSCSPEPQLQHIRSCLKGLKFTKPNDFIEFAHPFVLFTNDCIGFAHPFVLFNSKHFLIFNVSTTIKTYFTVCLLIWHFCVRKKMFSFVFRLLFLPQNDEPRWRYLRILLTSFLLVLSSPATSNVSLLKLLWSTNLSLFQRSVKVLFSFLCMWNIYRLI